MLRSYCLRPQYERMKTMRLRIRRPVALCLLSAFAATISVLAACPLCADERPPNFIIFFTDDQGYNDVGCFGSPLIKTPCFDRMAREGMRFTDFYVQPVCGVSRAALMTGCYPIRVAEVGNTKSGHPILHPDEITLAEVLKTRGYSTGLIGKWHLAGPRQTEYKPELMPGAQGFDYFFGTPAHNGFTRTVTAKSFKTQLMRGGEILDDFLEQDEMDTLTQRYTAEAIEFITKNKDRPFFLYLAHNMPHVPLGASKDFRGKSKRGLYGDVIQELDWSAGQVMDTLKELGIDENTLMVYTSDNGPWIEQQIGDYAGCADPLRGSKMKTWDGGPRVPCIMRWPGKIPAGKVSQELVTSMDLAPTFASLAGASMPTDRIIDGKNVLPILLDEPDAKSPHTAYYYYCYNHLQAVRSGKWKLVLPRPAKPPWTSWSARLIDAVERTELYDLAADVGETKNVAGENPEIVAELMQLVEKAREDLGDYDRIGKGARFFDEQPRRPDALRWQRRPVPKDGGGPYPSSFTYTTAIGPEKGVTRRDPSDVIRAGDAYYVWYTKVTKDQIGYPSGYPGSIWYATSPDGRKWTEQGPCIEPGPKDAWDGHGAFTPNILVADGAYYLFYTAVPNPFPEPWQKNNITKTAIGIALADGPEGPWRKFKGNPVLIPEKDETYFDSFRCDDASLIVRDGKYWLYYKGRQMGRTPGETKMGVAIAEVPTGPYVKHEAGPLHAGHEVLVWPHGPGVASMATAAGPRQIYHAADGLHFEQRHAVTNAPRAPGGFRGDNFLSSAKGEGLRWGIGHTGRGELYLVRFDGLMTPALAPRPSAGNRPKPVPYDNAPPVGDLRFDFETGDMQGWRVTEGQFDLVVSDRPALPMWTDVPFNKQGKYHLSTVERKSGGGVDAMTGTIESPRFVLRGKAMSFLVGGGDSDQTYVALCTLSGKQLMQAGGTNSPVMRRVRWDVSRYVGQTLLLRIVDRKQKSWAHITFDDFSTDGQLLPSIDE